MIETTVTEFARNMKEILNRVEYQGEEVHLLRNKRLFAKLVPETGHHHALEVLADLYRTLPEPAAETWLEDARRSSALETVKDPWGT